jgi:hypothetical protein
LAAIYCGGASILPCASLSLMRRKSDARRSLADPNSAILFAV